jgi:hypothetical protein
VHRLDLGAPAAALLEVAKDQELVHADDASVDLCDEDGVARRGRDLVEGRGVRPEVARVLLGRHRAAVEELGQPGDIPVDGGADRNGRAGRDRRRHARARRNAAAMSAASASSS